MHNYIVIGAGLAGAHAVDGIREIDKEGSVLLIGNEKSLPYDRPPLTKGLWTGKKKVEKIFLHDQAYYDSIGVEVKLKTRAMNVDPLQRKITTVDGAQYLYGKLLLATGGTPRRLNIPGANLQEVCYYRYLDDYNFCRSRLREGSSVVVIGGGFIGSELAASLRQNNIKVHLIFPEKRICARVMPSDLADSLTGMFMERGIDVYPEDVPVSISRQGGQVTVTTRGGWELKADLVIAGLGIKPDTEIASDAGLKVTNGIEVNEFLQTSDINIFSAGDNTNFIYQALDKRMRVEHWDNAVSQGRHAGRNMAGTLTEYSYMPYFFSDLFEFGYEAVGDLNSELDIIADWEKPFEKGVLYYLYQQQVRGIMLCNVWGKVGDSRRIIRDKKCVSEKDLKGAIPFN